MIPAAEERPLLTVDEFVELTDGAFGRRSAIHDAINRGELPAMTIGRRRYLVVARLRQQLGLDPPMAGPPRPTAVPAGPTAGPTPPRHDGHRAVPLLARRRAHRPSAA